MASFDEVLKDCTKLGTKIPTSEYLENGKYPIIDQGQSDVAGYYDSDDGLFENVPAIVFGDHTRAVKYIDKPCFLGADGVKLLCPVDKDINCKYLFYQLSCADIPNTGYNRHFKWVKALDFKIPSSDEQNHVVEVLDKVTDLILIRQQQLAKLDELVKARFAEMFRDDSHYVKLSDVASVTGGLTKKLSRDKMSLKLPYLRVANVSFAKIDTTDISEIGLTEDEKDKTLLSYGDLLFVEGNGSPEQIGRVAIWKNEIIPCVHQNHLIKARFDDLVIVPCFALYYFMSQEGRKQIQSKAVSTSGLYTLSVSKISDLLIPLPSLTLQNQFAAFVEIVDQQKQTVQQSLEKLELMKKALMQKYFGVR